MPNIGAPEYMRQMLTSIKGEIDSNIITVGDFYTPVTSMDISSRQKISKKTQALNDTLDQIDLTDVYNHSIPKQQNIHSSSSEHGIFSRIDHILVHRANLGKYQKSFFSIAYLTSIFFFF